MPNEQYQSLFGLGPADVRALFLDGAPPEVHEFCRRLGRRGAGRHWSWTSAATTSPACSRSSARATPRPTGPASCSPTPSRAGGCRRRATRATTRRCSAATRSPTCARSSGSTSRPSGTASTRRHPAGSWAASRREHLARPPRPRPLGVTVPASTGRTRRQADLDPGGVRPGPGRPVARRGRGAVPRHDGARRRDVDEPGRVHQQDGRLRARRAARLERATRCCGGPRAPSGQHIELGISRDEPLPAARPARPVVGPVGPAAAAGRHGLRPVRAARAGRLHLRGLLRARGSSIAGHAVRGDPGARGRRPPVDDHAVGRARAARR